MSFYFAWISASETAFDAVAHAREDEDVFAFSIEYAEGDFAGVEIEIRNPRVGLLAPARKVHAFLSYDTGTEIKPLFRGRLVGIPDDINQEVVRLQFRARPDDYAAQKTALASTLKQAVGGAPRRECRNVARDAADDAGLPRIDIAHRDVDVPFSQLGEHQSAALGKVVRLTGARSKCP